jgi:hypothetical protein
MAGSNDDSKRERAPIMAMHYQLAVATKDDIITIHFTERCACYAVSLHYLTIGMLLLAGNLFHLL